MKRKRDVQSSSEEEEEGSSEDDSDEEEKKGRMKEMQDLEDSGSGSRRVGQRVGRSRLRKTARANKMLS